MFGLFSKKQKNTELVVSYKAHSGLKYVSLSDYLRKEVQQEEYLIKMEIYALTKNLGVMNMSLEGALQYKMNEDLKFKDYKQAQYDLTTGFPRDRAGINLVNLFFQFECLNRENKLDEVLTNIENMANFYNNRGFFIYLSYCYFLQGLNRKPCNKNLTAFMTSIGAWPKRLGD